MLKKNKHRFTPKKILPKFFMELAPIIFLLWCNLAIAQEFIYDSHGKKDPFSPPVIKAVEKAGTEVLTGVRLEGIIWDEKNPIAIINDKVVRIGDEVSGAKITEIRQNEVIFDINGQMISVKLIIKDEGGT